MKKKTLLVTATATALALSMAFGGTMAYFSATSVTVENDIAVDYNWVKLTESGTTYDEDNDVYVNNSYEIIPGTTQDKDPTVTVSYNVDSYVFLYVTDATNGLVTYEIESDWTILSSYVNDDGNTVTVYYQLVEYNSASAKTSEDGISYNLSDLSVLVNDSISYSSSIVNGTGENGNGITVAEDGTPSGTATVSLTFYAEIQQKSIQTLKLVDPTAYNDLVKEAEDDADEDDVVVDLNTGVYYTSLNDAISAASAGDTVVLLADQTESTVLTISEDLVLDLNKNTLTIDDVAATSSAITVDDAEVAIENGTVTTAGCVTVQSDGTLNLESSTIKSTGGYALYVSSGEVNLVSSTVDSVNNVNNETVVLFANDSDNDVTMNIDAKSKVVGNYQGIALNADSGCTATLNVYGTVEVVSDSAITGKYTLNGNNDINVYEGAVVTSTNEVAIYKPNWGTVNVYGGTITGSVCGIEMRNGVLNVYGGTVVGTGNPSSTSYDGSAIKVQTYTLAHLDASGDTVVAATTVNLYGGTLKSSYGYGYNFFKLDKSYGDDKIHAMNYLTITDEVDTSDCSQGAISITENIKEYLTVTDSRTTSVEEQ